MATYSIEKLPSLPVLLISITEKFEFKRDYTAFRVKVSQQLDSLSGPVYYVLNLGDSYFELGILRPSPITPPGSIIPTFITATSGR